MDHHKVDLEGLMRSVQFIAKLNKIESRGLT